MPNTATRAPRFMPLSSLEHIASSFADCGPGSIATCYATVNQPQPDANHHAKLTAEQCDALDAALATMNPELELTAEQLEAMYTAQDAVEAANSARFDVLLSVLHVVGGYSAGMGHEESDQLLFDATRQDKGSLLLLQELMPINNAELLRLAREVGAW